MEFANPWGLLALLSLPAIAVIHLYRRRFPPLRIAGLHLWGIESEVRAAGRRRERLPITATLLLELLAGLLLALLLSRPRLADLDSIEHLVVVLDNSASMQAKPKDGASFRDAAIAELDTRFEGLGRRGRVTVILTGRQPATLVGPAAEWQQAKTELESWQPAEPQHEFDAAWDEAAQLAEQTGGRLLFLTDRLPAEDAAVPKAMEVVSLGRPVQNVAVSAAQWTFDSRTATGHLFLRVDNLGTQGAQAAVRGRAKDRTLFSRSLSIPAGGSIPLETDLPGGLGRLTIDVEAPGDGLEIDNRVTLVEPKVRMLTVAITLPEGDAAKKAVERVLAEIPDIQNGAANAAHLIVGPAGDLPPSSDDLWWLGIGPIDRSAAAMEKAQTPSARFPFLIEKRNPLLDGIVLGGIVWAGVQPLDLDVIPLISAGEHRLLGQLRGTRTRAYLLNIDLGKSNLTESPDWPILVKNLVDMSRDSLPGLRRWNYRLGETVRFQSDERAANGASYTESALRLVHDGESRPLIASSDGTVEVPTRYGTGVYEVKHGDQSYGELAVNFFDIEESTLNRLAPGARAAQGDDESQKLTLDDPYSWLIMVGTALVLTVVVLDWRVLKKER
ncbi:MAG: BatA and WFA domain-containing protein [Planctomycetaceae bacterium]